ncbi:protein translocase subunit SecD [Deltaproteobacteria bacterium]|nr:protein translocase subunit SecD [Deltaproteobacteria bacterium]
MEAGLIARVGITAASLLLGLWMLTPTFLPGPQHAELTRVCELAELKDPPEDAAPPQTFTKFLPCKFLVKGLDLQGGVDLTLYVDVDEAVRSTVQREIPTLKRIAADKGVALDDVRRDRREPELLIAPGAGVTLAQVKELVSGRLDRYTYTNTVDEAGKSWLVFRMTDARTDEIRKQAVEQAREVIESRINGTGVKEPSITRKGETGINVQLPGESDMEQAKAAIGTTAQLGFLLVDEEFDQTQADAALPAAKLALGDTDYLDDRLLSEWLQDNGVLHVGQRLYWFYDKDKKPAARTGSVVLKDEVLLTGDDVSTARTEQDHQTGNYYVALDFKPHGSAIFSEVTGNNIGKRIAIVLDDHVSSAPTVQSKINGVASITVGGNTQEATFNEASNLSLVLRTGALPAPVTVGEVRTIGPQLGDKAIKQGTLASAIGCVLVFLFAGIYYRVSGLLADLSLALNGLLVLALLVGFGATLTLPGICGIALTIGMAVDANIIIFERIREELRGGKSARTAIETGFDRASVAVIDSNLCTGLAGVVLYSYGTGPLKGFGVTLLIGIITTLFTGVFVSRTLMEWAFGSRNTANVSI